MARVRHTIEVEVGDSEYQRLAKAAEANGHTINWVTVKLLRFALNRSADKYLDLYANMVKPVPQMERPEVT